MRVVVDGFGKYIGTEGELITIKEKNKIIRRLKPDELKQIILIGNNSIGTKAIRLLLKHAVDIVIIDFYGKIVGRLMHPAVGTVRTRRDQYEAYNDKRGVLLSKEFLLSKLINQVSLLTNLAKARKDSNPEVAEKIMQIRKEISAIAESIKGARGGRIDDVREKIMGLEGKASNHYWSALSLIFSNFGFKGRHGIDSSPRFAQDIFNAILNYGYSVLHTECIRAIELAGLDCYAGFLHSDKAGRQSLALDLMEEFRQPLIDRSVIKLLSYRQIKPDECEVKNYCILKDSARKKLLNEIISRFESKTQYHGKNMAYSNIILWQARKIASFLRGESRYQGFTQRW
jgi:CRISPR-associated protein Cas1